METKASVSKETPKTTYLRDYQPPSFLIDTVDLTFDLGEDNTFVQAKMALHRNPLNANKDLVLHGELLKLRCVNLNGDILDESRYRVTDKTLTVLNVPDQFELTIENEISPRQNTALTGLYVSSNNFCTQCEAEGFRRITYFLDRPDVMAKYTTTIRADQKRYPILLSNGNSVGSGLLDNGRHWVKWEDPFKKPSYLFALVAGDFDCLEDVFYTRSGRKVDLRIYVEKGNLPKTHFAMQAVKKAMRWDEETFNREYDLDIYMIVAVSDFNMGAMENKGLNIFNTKYILASPETATDQDYINIEAVIAHEYFHNWSGDRVTCRDWFQLSLKEGLTVFRDQCFTMDTTSRTVARIQDVTTLRNVQFPEDNSPLAHPVQPDSYIEINNFYTPTVYEKGAEVIRMMQTMLGDATFKKAMDLYFERHDGQAVTIEEFVKAMEDASRMDLKQFRIWYTQAGTPVLTIASDYRPDKQEFVLTINQSCPLTPGQSNKQPLHIPVKIGLLNSKGAEVAAELLHVKKATEVFTFPGIVEKPIPSLLRGFSAPVKVQYDYSDEALLFLFQHDQDEFNRWEAGQQYAVRLILQLINAYRNKKPLNVPDAYTSALSTLLHQHTKDHLLLVEMLTLPSEKYIAEQMTVVDVDAIHAVREFILLHIAQSLKKTFIDLYHQYETLPNEFTMKTVGARRLKNLCLFYLMLLPEQATRDNLAIRQLKQTLTSNMTDSLSALKCLSEIDNADREAALDQFYRQWHQEALVIDKWFLVQATSSLPDTLECVKRLTQHEAFDIKNPNKVYSLVGGFCQQNQVRFHDDSGQGYQFLSEIVLRLDALNPQVASRMVKPLTTWRRFDPKRQQLMKTQLELILKRSGLSEDVYELVQKSLKG